MLTSAMCERGARLGDLGLLLAGAEARQRPAPLVDAVAMVGVELDKRRADLEADLREDARLDRARSRTRRTGTLLSTAATSTWIGRLLMTVTAARISARIAPPTSAYRKGRRRSSGLFDAASFASLLLAG